MDRQKKKTEKRQIENTWSMRQKDTNTKKEIKVLKCDDIDMMRKFHFFVLNRALMPSCHFINAWTIITLKNKSDW
jgi:hypothetical protein